MKKTWEMKSKFKGILLVFFDIKVKLDFQISKSEPTLLQQGSQNFASMVKKKKGKKCVL